MLEIAYNFMCQLYPSNLSFFFKRGAVRSRTQIHAFFFFFFATQYSVSPGATIQRGYIIFPKSAESELFYENFIFKEVLFFFLAFGSP